MTVQEKANRIGEILDQLFPDPQPMLYHTNAYTLLVAVVLSAQCTDRKVNQVTPHLFELASSPEQMVELGPEHIKSIIRELGLATSKALNIFGLSKILVQNYGGQVPNVCSELEGLPGVGHKTASVVMAQAFGVPSFPVDTHIHRLARRWGLSDGRNVRSTEASLKGLFPESLWNRRHLQVVLFGREYCKALGHKTQDCPICSWASVDIEQAATE